MVEGRLGRAGADRARSVTSLPPLPPTPLPVYNYGLTKFAGGTRRFAANCLFGLLMAWCGEVLWASRYSAKSTNLGGLVYVGRPELSLSLTVYSVATPSLRSRYDLTPGESVVTNPDNRAPFQFLYNFSFYPPKPRFDNLIVHND
jgi:hypothetical protein